MDEVKVTRGSPFTALVSGSGLLLVPVVTTSLLARNYRHAGLLSFAGAQGANLVSRSGLSQCLDTEPDQETITKCHSSRWARSPVGFRHYQIFALTSKQRGKKSSVVLLQKVSLR